SAHSSPLSRAHRNSIPIVRVSSVRFRGPTRQGSDPAVIRPEGVMMAPGSGQDQTSAATVPSLLRTARLEVIPTRGILDAVRTHSPVHRTVTITASESLSLDATLELAGALRADGRTVVPHLAARMVAGRPHLAE